MEGASPSQSGYRFSAMHASQEIATVNMQIPGMHNALNALGALAVADSLELSVGEAAMALSDFRGTSRRFEVRGEANGVILVDDYAHHPTEIRSTLAAAKSKYPGRRIWALWQPHTYSRTLTLQHDFEQAFMDADQVLVTEVYAAREQRSANFDMSEIAEKIQLKPLLGSGTAAAIPNLARFTPSLGDAQSLLLNELQPGDVLVVMSAGDAIDMSARLFASLKDKEAKHA
jgi:UDP-N-acetylmuramate--alanine ligase